MVSEDKRFDPLIEKRPKHIGEWISILRQTLTLKHPHGTVKGEGT
jgi:hypothetical protein